MDSASTNQHEDDAPFVDQAFQRWRRLHRGASFTLATLAAVHSALTMRLFEHWAPDSVWFLGSGLGLLLLAAMNLAHVGLAPCHLPTARAVRAANWIFVIFGAGALVAVPEPQAAVIVVALSVQAVSSHRTLPGTA